MALLFGLVWSAHLAAAFLCLGLVHRYVFLDCIEVCIIMRVISIWTRYISCYIYVPYLLHIHKLKHIYQCLLQTM